METPGSRRHEDEQKIKEDGGGCLGTQRIHSIGVTHKPWSCLIVMPGLLNMLLPKLWRIDFKKFLPQIHDLFLHPPIFLIGIDAFRLSFHKSPLDGVHVRSSI